MAQVAGQNHAANQQGAWGAGIAQKNADFQNQLGAWNALYQGPVGLEQSQNLANVNRGLGVAGLAQNEGLARNSYDMTNTQERNRYNLGVNQIGNNFNLGRYGTQVQGYGVQQQTNTQRGIENNKQFGNITGLY